MNLELIRATKNNAVKKQKYEEAAKLRDDEKNLETNFYLHKKAWEKECKTTREIVTEEHIADVVSMMTGIPLNRSKANEIKTIHITEDYNE